MSKDNSVNMSDTAIRYGPSLCPGCNLCIECQQQRREVADLVLQLHKKIKTLKRKIKKT